jgi:hypothetical protein
MANPVARRLRKTMTRQEVKLWFIYDLGESAVTTFAVNRRVKATS